MIEAIEVVEVIEVIGSTLLRSEREGEGGHTQYGSSLRLSRERYTLGISFLRGQILFWDQYSLGTNPLLG